jgi:hypothetical protein
MVRSASEVVNVSFRFSFCLLGCWREFGDQVVVLSRARQRRCADGFIYECFDNAYYLSGLYAILSLRLPKIL